MRATPALRLLLSLSVFSCVCTSGVVAQSCDWHMFKRGATVTFEIRQWPNPYYSDPDFPRLNERRKERAIEEYKAEIEAGRIQPTITNFSYTVTVSEMSEESQFVELEASAYGQTFTSQMLCRADTMYLTRNKHPLVTEVNGKVVGLAFQGVQEIPMPLSLGDRLPPFEDIAITIPENGSFSVPDSIVTGYREVEYSYTTTRTTPDGYLAGSEHQTGRPTWTPARGYHYVHEETHTGTRLEDVYEYFHVDVETVLQTFMYNQGYAHAYVTGEETIDVLGTPRTALIIDAQSVARGFSEKTFASASREISDRLERQFRRQQDRATGMAVDMGYLEEGGFNITYGRDWFVPGFGVVRKAALDKYGGLQNETILISIR